MLTMSQNCRKYCLFALYVYFKGPTNLGMVFHTGYIRHTGSDLYLKLFTPGLGTNVHITGVLSGKTIDEWVVVKRDSPVSCQAFFYKELSFISLVW
jgi:hypothetical protein